MSAFLGIARLAFRQQATYRTAMMAGLVTNLFFGLLRAAVIIGLYGQQESVNGLDLRSAITFVGLSQALIAFLVIFGNIDLMRTVYSGSITTDLLKPISFFTYWLAREAGQSMVRLIWRGLLFMLIFSLFYPMTLPARLDQWLALPFILAAAWLVSFAWRFLVNLTSLWTPDARGILRLAFTISQLCAGFIFPLRLMPDWFNRAVSFTPFPAMVNTFIEVYIGTIHGMGIWLAFLTQLFWFALLALLAQYVMRQGLRRLVLQGG